MQYPSDWYMIVPYKYCIPLRSIVVPGSVCHKEKMSCQTCSFIVFNVFLCGKHRVWKLCVWGWTLYRNHSHSTPRKTSLVVWSFGFSNIFISWLQAVPQTQFSETQDVML